MLDCVRWTVEIYKTVKRSKSISFKTAFFIVIIMHVVVFVALSEFSSWRRKIAKQQRDQKREQMLANTNTANNWPKNTKSIKVVTHPKPLIKVETKNKLVPFLTKEQATQEIFKYKQIANRVEALGYTEAIKLSKLFVEKGTSLASMQTEINLNEETFFSILKEFEDIKSNLIELIDKER